METTTVGIIGLGLMGGSLALALRHSHPSWSFVGFDHNRQHAEEALRLSLVDGIADTMQTIEACDIIILAVPVDAIIAIARTITPQKESCTIIDLGSTKARISRSIPDDKRRFFVAAHPMTGTEKFGPKAAFAKLYDGKVVVLCDIEKSGTVQRERAVKLFESLKMKIVYMDAKEHDRHAAFISHMPHALSYALANAVMKQEDPESIVALAGGGFRDMSRIAKSNPAMWEDIFRQNKTYLLEAIAAFETELAQCKRLIEEEKWKELHAWMRDANQLHDIL